MAAWPSASARALLSQTLMEVCYPAACRCVHCACAVVTLPTFAGANTDGDLDVLMGDPFGLTLVTNVMTDADPTVAARVFQLSTPSLGEDATYATLFFADVTGYEPDGHRVEARGAYFVQD